MHLACVKKIGGAHLACGAQIEICICRVARANGGMRVLYGMHGGMHFRMAAGTAGPCSSSRSCSRRSRSCPSCAACVYAFAFPVCARHAAYGCPHAQVVDSNYIADNWERVEPMLQVLPRMAIYIPVCAPHATYAYPHAADLAAGLPGVLRGAPVYANARDARVSRVRSRACACAPTHGHARKPSDCVT